jgi:hypothetical protein
MATRSATGIIISAFSAGIEPSAVIAGLDPAIHLLDEKGMDARVKPAHDAESAMQIGRERGQCPAFRVRDTSQHL